MRGVVIGVLGSVLAALAQQPQEIGAVLVPAGPIEDIPADVVLQTGHSGPVTALAFSPAGDALASASDDGTVRLWNPATGRMRLRLDGGSALRTLAFSPDGGALAAGGDDHTIRIWNLAGKLRATLVGHDEIVTAVAFSPDGKRLISAGGGVWGDGIGDVRLWDAASGRLLRVVLSRAMGVTSVAFTADGAGMRVTTVEGDMDIRRTVGTYDTNSGELLDSQTDRTIDPQAWSPGGAWVVTAKQPSGAVEVRDSRSGVLKGSVAISGWEFDKFAVSPDGNLLAAGSRTSRIQVLKVSTGRPLTTIAPFSALLLEFTPDGKRLISYNQGAAPLEAHVWDLASRQEVPSSVPPLAIPAPLTVSSPGGRLTAKPGGTAFTVFDAVLHKPIRSFNPGEYVSAIAFSPDAAVVVCGTRAPMRVKTTPGPGRLPFEPPAGKTAVLAAWEIATGRQIFSVPAGHWVSAVAFTPDGASLLVASGEVTATADRVLQLDPRTGRRIATRLPRVDAAAAAAFSPDGQWLAATPQGVEAGIKLWKLPATTGGSTGRR